MDADTKALVTEIVLLDPLHPDPELLARAAAVIRAGGLVAFPTETVYGLGANAFDAVAVGRIFAAKARPAYDPIIVHVADISELDRISIAPSRLARRLAAHFWPGPLTLVLPKSPSVPDIVTAGGPTVAVRCPSHPLAQALIRAAGTPIAAPSANRFSHTSPTAAQHVWDDLAGRVELILDAGPTAIGVESTVLDVSGEKPVLLRPGGVTVEALTAVCTDLGVELVAQALKPREGVLVSPGMLDRHYAPRAALWLFSGPDVSLHAAMQSALSSVRANGQQVALMLADEDLYAWSGSDLPVRTVGPLTQLDDAARNLFHTMRELDATGVDLIFARDFPATGLGIAIRDRLRRAAERVILIDASEEACGGEG